MITRCAIQDVVLSVNLEGPPDWAIPGPVGIKHVQSGKAALQTLRAEIIDLMLVPFHGPDFTLPALMARVRAVRPKQRWMLVEPAMTVDQEICARAFGALKVLEAAPSSSWLAAFLGSSRIEQTEKEARRVRRVELNLG